MPLIINAIKEAEETEWEPVETVTVSRHGAMVRTRQRLNVGDTLDIRVRNKDRNARARVAWISTHLTEHGFELGFEILDQDGFWEINFPPDRWSEKAQLQKNQP